MLVFLTRQISLELLDVLDEVIKLDLSSLEEILRLWEWEYTLICTCMLKRKENQTVLVKMSSISQ